MGSTCRNGWVFGVDDALLAGALRCPLPPPPSQSLELVHGVSSELNAGTTSFVVGCRPSQWKAAVAAGLLELKRFYTHGLTAPELEFQLAVMAASLQVPSTCVHMCAFPLKCSVGGGKQDIFVGQGLGKKSKGKKSPHFHRIRRIFPDMFDDKPGKNVHEMEKVRCQFQKWRITQRETG